MPPIGAVSAVLMADTCLIHECRWGTHGVRHVLANLVSLLRDHRNYPFTMLTEEEFSA